VNLERRLNALREQRDSCHRLVAKLPRETPQLIVRAAKTVCNDIDVEIRRVLGRLGT
jgi:hypothetical protein